MANISNITRGRTKSSATIDGIQFSNIIKTGFNVATQVVRENNIWANENQQSILNSVNAVDINWNGAEYGERVNELLSEVPEGLAHGTINTTGELIDELARLRAQVDMLTPMVEAIYENYNSGDSGDPTPITRTVNLICSNELYPNSFAIMVDGHVAYESMIVTPGKTVQICIRLHEDIYNTDTVRINSNTSIQTDLYKKYWYFTMPNRNIQITLDLPYNNGIGYDDGIGDNNYNDGIGNN